MGVALNSAGEAVRLLHLGSAVDAECASLEESAANYAATWETAQAEMSDDSVVLLSAAAESLSIELSAFRDRISRASDALSIVMGQMDAASEWLDDVTAEGAREGLALAGLKTAVAALRVATSEPYDALGELTGAMEADIESLNEVAAVDDQLRSVFWASFVP